MLLCMWFASEPTAGKETERKRHISAPDESHSDSESTSLLSHHELTSTAQLLPRPRSSASLIDLIDSSTHSTSAAASIEQLVSDVSLSAVSVGTCLWVIPHQYVVLWPHVCLLSCHICRSISWPHGIKGDLSQALVLLGLVLHMLVVFINCCLSFVLSLSSSYKWLC